MSLLNILKKYRPNDKPKDVALIITYEVGDIAKALVYMEKDDPANAGAHTQELRKAIADAITQLHVLAEMFNFSWTALQLEGKESFETKMEQYTRVDRGWTSP